MFGRLPRFDVSVCLRFPFREVINACWSPGVQFNRHLDFKACVRAQVKAGVKDAFRDAFSGCGLRQARASLNVY